MKKKTWKRGLAVWLSLFMTINSLSGLDVWPQMVTYASTAEVNATTLNVRSGPGTTYAIAGKVTNGMNVTILGSTTGSDGKTWNQIRYTDGSNGQVTGYVLSTYLKAPTTYMTNVNFENYLNAQGFPESYKDGLRTLHAEYPNWIFTAQHTNLDWETVIDNESIVGRNLVYSSSLSSWKSTADGAYNWENSTWPGFDSSSYVAASEGIIRYYMDPRNFLDDIYVFQFLTHKFDPDQQTAEGLSQMLKGTFMESEATVGGATGPGMSAGGPGSSSSSVSSGGPGSGSTSVSTGGPGSGSTSVSTGGPGGSSSSSSSGGPGSSSTSVSPGGPGSSSTSVNGGGPGGSSASGGSSVGTTGPETGSGSGGVSFEGPSGSGNSDSGVSLLGPTASISKKMMNRVTTPAGPGSSSSSSNEIGPGVSPGRISLPADASYVDILMNSASRSGVNPYVLAAMILQEQGSQGSGKSISGTVAGYRGYYNFFNIEAYQSGSMDAVSRGLWYASQSGSYERPWNTVSRSIIGGSVYYGTNYVSVGQDTFYLKKFNVQGSNLYKHQYMTNIQAAASEGAKLADAYGDQLMQTALEFKIPVYLNMPEEASPKPTGDGSPNNKLSGLGVDGFALTPTFRRDRTSYDLIVDPSVSQITINAVPLASTASISGTGTIQLQSGNNEITVYVKAQNGSVREYQIHVVRQENGPTHNSSLGSGLSGSSMYGPGYSSVVSGPGIGTGGSTSGAVTGGNAGPGGSTSGAVTGGNAGPGGSASGAVTGGNAGPGGSTSGVVTGGNAGPGGSASGVMTGQSAGPGGSTSEVVTGGNAGPGGTTSGVVTGVAPSSAGSSQSVSGSGLGGTMTGPGGSNVTIIR